MLPTPPTGGGSRRDDDPDVSDERQPGDDAALCCEQRGRDLMVALPLAATTGDDASEQSGKVLPFRRPFVMNDCLVYEIMSDLGGSATLTLLAIQRQTVGWQRESARLSLSDLQRMTGLTRPTLRLALAELTAANIITSDACERGRTQVRAYTWITPDHWNMQALHEYRVNVQRPTRKDSFLVGKARKTINLVEPLTRKENNLDGGATRKDSFPSTRNKETNPKDKRDRQPATQGVAIADAAGPACADDTLDAMMAPVAEAPHMDTAAPVADSLIPPWDAPTLATPVAEPPPLTTRTTRAARARLTRKATVKRAAQTLFPDERDAEPSQPSQPTKAPKAAVASAQELAPPADWPERGVRESRESFYSRAVQNCANTAAATAYAAHLELAAPYTRQTLGRLAKLAKEIGRYGPVVRAIVKAQGYDSDPLDYVTKTALRLAREEREQQQAGVTARASYGAAATQQRRFAGSEAYWQGKGMGADHA